jgi:hypothetical protein
MPSQNDLLDLDIWMAQRPDGRVYAYTHSEPRFLTASAALDDVLAECRSALRAYAETAGHDLRFALHPSYRPDGMAVPAESLPVPHEGGSRVIGRVAVRGMSRAGGADLMAGDALAGFLASVRGRAPAARGRAAPPR